MKKIVVVLILVVVAASGTWMLLGNKTGEKKSGNEEPVQKKSGLINVVGKDGGYELWMDTGVKKVSMIDMAMKSTAIKITGVEVNSEVFNSEMQNKQTDTGEWRLTLGVMKATKDLPSGKVLIGKISFIGKGETKLSIEKSKITYGGEGSSQPEEVEVSDFTEELRIK